MTIVDLIKKQFGMLCCLLREVELTTYGGNRKKFNTSVQALLDSVLSPVTGVAEAKNIELILTLLL